MLTASPLLLVSPYCLLLQPDGQPHDPSWSEAAAPQATEGSSQENPHALPVLSLNPGS